MVEFLDAPFNCAFCCTPVLFRVTKLMRCSSNYSELTGCCFVYQHCSCSFFAGQSQVQRIIWKRNYRRACNPFFILLKAVSASLLQRKLLYSLIVSCSKDISSANMLSWIFSSSLVSRNWRIHTRRLFKSLVPKYLIMLEHILCSEQNLC